MSKVLVIGDTHFPFHDKKALSKVLDMIKKEKPTHVVQIGDLLDQYSFSKYSKSIEITPQQEVSKGIKAAVDMWIAVKRASKGVKCVQLLGNHDVRVSKRIMEKLPELEFVLKNGIYSFPGVKVLRSDRDYVKIDGVNYCHGWFSKSGDHVRHFNGPVVHGHLHNPTITTQGPGLWSMDVGYLADRHSLPLSYTQSKLTKWTMACGIVEDGKPRLILLE